MKPEVYFLSGVIYAAPHLSQSSALIASLIFIIIGAIKLIWSAK